MHINKKKDKKKELNKKMQIPEKLKYEESESLSYIEQLFPIQARDI